MQKEVRMNYIDLHVHTNKSDGTISPCEVAELAVKNKLTAIAITDHDTVAGVEEAINACSTYNREGHNLTIIPGVEISAEYHGRDIHILGLFINYQNKEFKEILNKTLKERASRNETMASRLRADGIPIYLKDLVFDEPETVITRAHFARYLEEVGIVKSKEDAFTKYLGHHTKYYVPRKYLSTKDAIELILLADGIPVLAHPLLYNLSLEELDELISMLKSYGLVGLETIYSTHSDMDEGILRRYVNKYELLMTGGSDFHGTNKPQIELGTGFGNLKVQDTLLEDLYQFKQSHHKQ